MRNLVTKKNLVTILAAVTIFFSVTIQLHADNNFAVKECQRRNVLLGCRCECSDPSGLGVVRGCPLSNPTGPDDCSTVISSVNQSVTSSFNFFPAGNTGIINYDANGQLVVAATLSNIIFMLFVILAVVAVVIAFKGGFDIINSQGNDDQITQGRSTLKNALIGVFICGLAAIIVFFAAKAFNFGDNPNQITDITTIPKTTTDKQFFDDLFKWNP